MIVRSAGQGLHLITQPDHALLARRVMERWAPLYGAERRSLILHAIEEHDNGWREPDAAPAMNADGRVYDFTALPAAERQAVWPRGVARLADEPWAAALVAHHAITVYDRYRSDPEWQGFFPAMEELRGTHLAAAGLSQAKLAHDYQFLRLGDLISLVFCNQWDEPQTYDRWQITRRGDTVLVQPDPFQGRELPLAITATVLPRQQFESDAALRSAFRGAPRVVLTGLCKGADPA